MEQIIVLNNLGVVCIDANKFREAVHNLACTLELAKNQIYMNQLLSHRPCDGTSPHHHNAPPQSPRTPSSLQDTMAVANVYNTGHHLRNEDEAQPFHYSSAIKYHHPFKLFPDDILIDPTTKTSFTSSHSLMSSTPTPSIAEAHAKRIITLSAIIIFNLALCYDMLASSMRTRQNVWKDKAISLYEKVVELYLQAYMYSDVQDTSTNTSARVVLTSSYSGMLWRAQGDMVVMAAINNLVQLYQEPSSSSSRKEKYIALMMAILQEVQQTEYGSEEIQILVILQARVFASNTVLASRSSSCCMTFWSPLTFSAAAA